MLTTVILFVYPWGTSLNPNFKTKYLSHDYMQPTYRHVTKPTYNKHQKCSQQIKTFNH